MAFARTTWGCGTLAPLAVTGCTGNAVPIVLTIGAGIPASVAVGQRILVASVGGNTNANGPKTITAIDYVLKKISIDGPNGNAAWTSGGQVTREYATIDLAQTATVANLTSGGGSPQNEIRTIECYADGDFTYAFGSSLTFAGCTVDANHFRILRAWHGHEWDPRSRTGVRIVATVGVGNPNAIVINEQYFQMRDIGVELLDGGVSSGGPYSGVKITADNVYCDAVQSKIAAGSSAVTWNCFYHPSSPPSGGSSGTKSTFTNCIAVGSNVPNVGATAGFRSTQDFDRFYNCVGFGCQNGTGHAFNVAGTGAEVRNCIGMNSSGNDFVATGTFDHCISSDSSATGTASQTGLFAVDVFVYPTFEDFRVLQSSAALDSGVDLSATVVYIDNPNVNVKLTYDFVGTTRTAPWEMGCYNGFGSPPVGQPTEVVSTVGATGRDYATLAAWKTATDLNLVYLFVKHVAECYDDADFAVSSDVDLAGAVTDYRCYREIRPAAGQHYDPVTDTGVAIIGTATLDTLRITEDFSRVSGVRVENLTAGTSDRSAVKLVGVGTIADGVLAYLPNGTAGNRRCFWGSGTTQRFRNCIAIGNTNTDGADVGFYVTGSSSKVQNCVAAKVRRGSTGTCFKDGGGAGGVRFQNCIAGASDVGFNVVVGWQDHNASKDASASGVGSLTSIDDDATFVDWPNLDFRLRAGSVCVNAGVKLATEFTDDFDGATRNSSWDMGAYDNYLMPAEFPAPQTSPTAGLATCWVIERRDGVALYFTDHDSPLVHKGVTFVAAGGFDASARRKEVGLKENNVEARGMITSDAITFDDLRAGRYKGAQVIEYLVDPKLPHLAPRETNVYTIRETSEDGEKWSGQLAGLSSKLGTSTGGIFGRACDANLGDERCGVDLVALTLFDQVVTDASVDPILEFEASGLPGGGVYVDDYFQLGKVTWKTGDNIGLESECRQYVASTRTVRIYLELPFPIQVGDTFDIAPGCSLDYDASCVTKFANGINFRGFKDIPGTDKALQSPSQ